MNTGYVKLYRNILNSYIFNNEKLLKIFIWCLLKASHREREQVVGRKKIVLREGQFIFGRHKAAEELDMAASTVWDYMKLMEENNVISIESNNKYSIVTLDKWAVYQARENFLDNKYDKIYDMKLTTNEQQIDTNKKDNNFDNEKNNKELYFKIINELNKKANKNYRSNTLKTVQCIEARLKEGFKEEDFYKVINNKCKDWLNDNIMDKYLRPETLFGSKFENYLNENTNNPKTISPDNILYTKTKTEYSEDCLEIKRKEHGLL